MTEFHPTNQAEENDKASTTAQEFSDLSRATELPADIDKDHEIESHDLSHDLIGEDKKETLVEVVSNDEDRELNDLNASDRVEEEEGESISTKDVQESMDNIFKLLKIDSANPNSEASPPMNFDEFTKMLTGGEDGGGGLLTSTEKSLALGEGPKTDEFVSLTPRSPREKRPGASALGAAEDNSEIVNAAGAPTPAEHLKLLKEKIPPAENDEVPLLSDLGVTDESIAESLAEQKKKKEAEEAPWPDIGQAEVDENTAKEEGEGKTEQVNDDVKSSSSLSVHLPQDQPTNSDRSGGVAEPAPSPWAPGGEREAPVISALVMPSADVAVDVTTKHSEIVEKSHHVPEPSHEQQEESQDQSERDVTPGLTDDKGEELSQEVGGGKSPAELVSRARKRNRRGVRAKGKKTSPNTNTIGMAALPEVGRQEYVLIIIIIPIY